MMLQISPENDELRDMRMLLPALCNNSRNQGFKKFLRKFLRVRWFMKPYKIRTTIDLIVHSACSRRSTTHRLTLSSCIVDQQQPDLKPRDNRREHKKTVQIGISFNFLFCFDRSLLKVTLWHGDGMWAWGLLVDQQWCGNLWKLCYWMSCDLICADFWLSEGWAWVKTGERNWLWSISFHFQIKVSRFN